MDSPMTLGFHEFWPNKHETYITTYSTDVSHKTSSTILGRLGCSPLQTSEKVHSGWR